MEGARDALSLLQGQGFCGPRGTPLGLDATCVLGPAVAGCVPGRTIYPGPPRSPSCRGQEKTGSPGAPGGAHGRGRSQEPQGQGVPTVLQGMPLHCVLSLGWFCRLSHPRHQTGNPLGSVIPRVGPLGGPVPLPSLKAPRRSLRKVEHSSRLRWQQLPPPTPGTSPHPRLLPRPGWPSSSPTVAAGPAWGPVPAAQGSRGPSPRAPGALGPPQVLPRHLPSRTWSCVSPRSPPTVTSWSFPSLGSSACMQWPRAPRPGDPPPA